MFSCFTETEREQDMLKSSYDLIARENVLQKV